TGRGAMPGVFTPTGQQVYIANAGEATVALVDVAARRVVRTLPGGQGATAFAPIATWHPAWLTGPDEDKVILLDLVTGVPVATIAVPGEPHSLVLSPDEQWAYVVQRRLNQLTVIDTAARTVHKTVSLGPRPDMLAINPTGTALYVTVRDEAKLYVVSTTDLTVTATVPTGPDPHGVAYRHATAPVTVARARAGEMSWETGSPASQGAPSPDQPLMMGQGMMGQGMCWGGCMLPATAASMGGQGDPLDLRGMMGLMGGMEAGPMEPKARGQLLQMRGEMLKAIGDIMIKHGQALQAAP